MSRAGDRAVVAVKFGASRQPLDGRSEAIERLVRGHASCGPAGKDEPRLRRSSLHMFVDDNIPIVCLENYRVRAHVSHEVTEYEAALRSTLARLSRVAPPLVGACRIFAGA